MYNRYIPQSDGSYRRSSVPEPSAPSRSHESPKPPAPPPPPPVPECPAPQTKQPSRHRCANCNNCRPSRKPPEPPSFGIGSFLKTLLPKDFDTGDLLVVILLLLMSADECEDQSTALLTLALYLFL